MKKFNRLLLLAFISLLAGCATGPSKFTKDGPPGYDVDVSNIPDAVPKVEPRSRYGNPSSYRVNGKTYHTMTSYSGYREKGIASWYGTKFHGQTTSSREPYNMLGMTAAHRALPLPTYARITNLQNGRQVIVKVNDRGPFEANRLIDLSYAAAKKLGITQRGTGLVEVEAIDPHQPQAIKQYATQQVSQTMPAHSPTLYMQIGAFASQDNAVQLMNRVKRFTQRNIRVKAAESNGRTVYRVQIGPLADVAESDVLHQKLSVEKLGTPMTVVD